MNTHMRMEDTKQKSIMYVMSMVIHNMYIFGMCWVAKSLKFQFGVSCKVGVVMGVTVSVLMHVSGTGNN
jgi:hypothetical protein